MAAAGNQSWPRPIVLPPTDCMSVFVFVFVCGAHGCVNYFALNIYELPPQRAD